ncbi:RpiB/LacA/LacB family sugar-phosphate isomerase [Candidatus Dependentiae bacterium]|nr:RpiB/LacA/LacB family sugar-phosphate isomerase [Candidatus Dependentiae bacterium]
MKIFIGADHRGFMLKNKLMQTLIEYTWVDCGCFSTDRTDYPIYAQSVCEGVLQDTENHRGILICGSGIGMSIAANRFKKIYAALCWNEAITASARADDNANVLVLSANEISFETALTLIPIFLTTPFKAGHYEQRLCMIDKARY